MTSHGNERGPHEPPAGPGGHPFEVRVPTPRAGDIVVDIRARRADVVHRLMNLGVSRCTLTALLPEWSKLIAAVASEHLEYR